jgi:hypothetical protein
MESVEPQAWNLIRRTVWVSGSVRARMMSKDLAK